MENEIKLQMMTPEELRTHIKKCEEVLAQKRNERWLELIGNLSSAAQALINEYPNAVLRCETYCEECETRIDTEISVDHLAFEDGYARY